MSYDRAVTRPPLTALALVPLLLGCRGADILFGVAALTTLPVGGGGGVPDQFTEKVLESQRIPKSSSDWAYRAVAVAAAAAQEGQVQVTITAHRFKRCEVVYREKIERWRIGGDGKRTKLGTDVRDRRETETCEEAPLGGGAIALLGSNGAPLLEGTADAAGVMLASLPEERLSKGGPQYGLVVAGQPVEGGTGALVLRWEKARAGGGEGLPPIERGPAAAEKETWFAKCDQDRRVYLERALGRLAPGRAALAARAVVLTKGATRAVVRAPAGAPVEVLLIGFEPLRVEKVTVKGTVEELPDGQPGELKLHQVRRRVVSAAEGDVEVTARGLGCAVLAALPAG